MVQDNRLLHRLKQAREIAGVSLRSLSRQTGIPIGELRRQEESNNVALPDLMRWQAALTIPFIDLLRDVPDGMDEVVRLRAGLIQLMRSVRLLMNDDDASAAHIAVAKNMAKELEAMMPELKAVRPWPQYGGGRSRNEPAQIESRIVPISTWFPEIGREV